MFILRLLFEHRINRFACCRDTMCQWQKYMVIICKRISETWRLQHHSSFALEPASVGERRRHQHESSNSMNKSAILSHKWRSKYIQVIDIRCLPACYTNVQVICTLVAIRYRMEKFSFIFTTHFEIRREKNTTNKHWRWKDIERECVRILLLPYAAHTHTHTHTLEICFYFEITGRKKMRNASKHIHEICQSLSNINAWIQKWKKYEDC